MVSQFALAAVENFVTAAIVTSIVSDMETVPTTNTIDIAELKNIRTKMGSPDIKLADMYLLREKFTRIVKDRLLSSWCGHYLLSVDHLNLRVETMRYVESYEWCKLETVITAASTTGDKANLTATITSSCCSSTYTPTSAMRILKDTVEQVACSFVANVLMATAETAVDATCMLIERHNNKPIPKALEVAAKIATLAAVSYVSGIAVVPYVVGRIAPYAFGILSNAIMN